MNWAGFQLSLRPADEDHPYGHGKLEALAGGFAGVALLVATGVIAANAVSEILKPHHAREGFTLSVLIGVVFVKEWLRAASFPLAMKSAARLCVVMPGTTAPMRSLRELPRSASPWH